MTDKHATADAINRQTDAEGWALFHTSGTDDIGEYRIERYDEAEIFPNDPAAWAHVVARALAGSEPHRAALAFIKAENATEWTEILQAQPDAESASSQI